MVFVSFGRPCPNAKAVQGEQSGMARRSGATDMPLQQAHFVPSTNFIPTEQTMSDSDALEDRKGESIKLVGNTAKKHRHCLNAWLDTGKAPTKCHCHTIIEKPDPEDHLHTHLDCCKALKENCTMPDPPPTAHLQAAFAQVPALEERLTDFAKILAKCRIQSGRELSSKIKAALDREHSNLLRKGSSAECRPIDTSELPDVVPPDEGGDMNA